MPSANGVYSLPVGYLAVTGQTILASQHNPPLEDIATALTGRLSRDGTAPMTGAVQAAAGSVGNPSLTFAADNTTGFYKTAAGIGVSVAGMKTVEFTAAGIASGNRFLGELIPYTCTAAPALTVLPFGQTLNRITYAALWTQAQIEIAAGNTLYNNGDGSTTFGILDMRGRLPAGWDKMGGSASGRLTTAGGGVDGTTLGAVGGAQNQTLTLAQLPTGITVGGTLSSSSSGFATLPGSNSGATDLETASSPGSGKHVPTNSSGWGAVNSFTGSMTSNNTSGNAHPIVPPAIVTNFILFAGA